MRDQVGIWDGTNQPYPYFARTHSSCHPPPPNLNFFWDVESTQYPPPYVDPLYKEVGQKLRSRSQPVMITVVVGVGQWTAFWCVLNSWSREQLSIPSPSIWDCQRAMQPTHGLLWRVPSKGGGEQAISINIFPGFLFPHGSPKPGASDDMCRCPIWTRSIKVGIWFTCVFFPRGGVGFQGENAPPTKKSFLGPSQRGPGWGGGVTTVRFLSRAIHPHSPTAGGWTPSPSRMVKKSSGTSSSPLCSIRFKPNLFPPLHSKLWFFMLFHCFICLTWIRWLPALLSSRTIRGLHPLQHHLRVRPGVLSVFVQALAIAPSGGIWLSRWSRGPARRTRRARLQISAQGGEPNLLPKCAFYTTPLPLNRPAGIPPRNDIFLRVFKGQGNMT